MSPFWCWVPKFPSPNQPQNVNDLYVFVKENILKKFMFFNLITNYWKYWHCVQEASIDLHYCWMPMTKLIIACFYINADIHCSGNIKVTFSKETLWRDFEHFQSKPKSRYRFNLACHNFDYSLISTSNASLASVPYKLKNARKSNQRCASKPCKTV